MRMISSERLIKCSILLVCGAFLFSCAGIGSYEPSFEVTAVNEGESLNWPDPSLKKEFFEYWEIRFNGDTVNLFTKEAPHLQEMIAFQRYHDYMVGAGRNTLNAMEIVDLQSKKEFYKVIKMNLKFTMLNGSENETYIEDKWVKVDGKWYHLFSDRFLFPEISGLADPKRVS